MREPELIYPTVRLHDSWLVARDEWGRGVQQPGAGLHPDDEGAISLRHALNDFLLRAGGHIGYGLRPSARGRGLAAWALRSILPRAQELGQGRVLITCEDSNAASARTIEKPGGMLGPISLRSGHVKGASLVDRGPYRGVTRPLTPNGAADQVADSPSALP